jgi:MFS superfamily sulfate permease-like transporter
MSTLLAQRRAEFVGALRTDLLASIVVFLVALPLCMGIAIASGVPPAAGLITGIVGGLVVGFLAGAPLQVSGPAAGLAVIVWELIQRHGLAALGIIVLLAGMIQLTAGAMRLGQWFRAVSPAVIQGMLAGIGVLIFASQFHVMVDDRPKGSGLTNLLTIPQAIQRGVTPVEGTSHHLAALVGLLTIASIVLWMHFAPRRLKMIPAPLAAVVVAVIFAGVLALPVRYVAVPSNLLDAVRLPSSETLALVASGPILGAALALAVVASAETLLCATAIDQRHTGPRTNYDRELMAQGVGNMLCGALGALPMTGVIVRSAANVEAGARTRLSAILHGAWILAFVAAMPWALERIPVSALAAVLVFTGYKLVNPVAIRALARQGRAELAIYAATVVGIVATDLLTGVLIGLGLSLAKLVYTFTHLTAEVEPGPTPGSHRVVLDGTATFVRLPKMAAALATLPAGSTVEVCAQRLAYIDHACMELLSSWERQHRAAGGTVTISWERLEQLSREARPAVAATPQVDQRTATATAA